MQNLNVKNQIPKKTRITQSKENSKNTKKKKHMNQKINSRKKKNPNG